MDEIIFIADLRKLCIQAGGYAQYRNRRQLQIHHVLRADRSSFRNSKVIIGLDFTQLGCIMRNRKVRETTGFQQDKNHGLTEAKLLGMQKRKYQFTGKKLWQK